MKSKFAAVVLVTMLPLMPACTLGVPDLNNANLTELTEDPTRALVIAAAQGLLVGHRVDASDDNGYVAILGVIGREAYNFDEADPRFIVELLVGPSLDPGSPRFGGNFWTVPYSNVRNANLLLDALERLDDMTDEEKEAVRGFAKTILALDLLVLINTHDTNGIIIEPAGEGGLYDDLDNLGPIRCKPAVLAHIGTLLDEAKEHLEAAYENAEEPGEVEFPFQLSSGFVGFDKPTTFVAFNRAVRARVAVYAEDYDAAQDALALSFITTDSADPQLDLGVYHVFGTGPGDSLNGLNTPNLLVHPSLTPGAQNKANGEPDDRVTNKIGSLEESRTSQNLTSDEEFLLYTSNTTPLAIIRNEELILLRAEVNYELGADPDDVLDDLNFIRVQSGRLGTLATDDIDTDTEFINALLYERRYSLLFEGGHRWIDSRRFGRLDDLPVDRAGDVVHEAFPIPIAESNARNDDITCQE